MPVDTKAADAAAQAAEEAARNARNAQDAAEIEFLGNVKRLDEITANRTTADANRLKSRYIGAFGFPAWQKLVADSR